MHAKYFPAYLPIPKYRVGVLQILNLKNDPLLENVVNDFSEQGNMTPPPRERHFLIQVLLSGGLNMAFGYFSL